VKIRPIRVIRVPGSNQIIKTKNNRQDLQDEPDRFYFIVILRSSAAVGFARRLTYPGESKNLDF